MAGAGIIARAGVKFRHSQDDETKMLFYLAEGKASEKALIEKYTVRQYLLLLGIRVDEAIARKPKPKPGTHS